MVFYIEPVPNLATIAIHRQWLTMEGVQDDMGDQFFGEVIWAVVIGTISHNDRQTISTVPSSNQMIRARFAGRIGATGGIGCGFGKQIIGSVEITIYLIGRYMVKSETLSLIL